MLIAVILIMPTIQHATELIWLILPSELLDQAMLNGQASMARLMPALRVRGLSTGPVQGRRY